MKHYDVFISGAGPAGSIAAYLLEKSGVSVGIADRRFFDRPNPAFVKSCGGLLAPDAQKALARLSFSLPKEILASPQIFAVKTLDLETGLSRLYQRCYLNIDRARFDRYLFGLSQSTDKYAGRVVRDIKHLPDGYKILLSDGTTLHSRLLIGADGACSVTAKRLGISRNARSYVCVQQLFRACEDQMLYSAVFDRRLTDYSGWTFVKDGIAYVGGAFLPDGSANEKLDTMVERLSGLGYRFGQKLSREGAMLLRPRFMPSAAVSGDCSCALIGEAAGLVSPSSAEGISFAINSAAAAYESIARKGDFSCYAAATRSLRMRLALKQLKLPFMYSPLLRSAVLKSGITAIHPFCTEAQTPSQKH